MKILLVGASGDIGQAVHKELLVRHDVLTAGRSSGDFRVNIGDRASIEALYRQTGRVDSIISTVGTVHFGPLQDFTHDQFMIGLTNKVMGQVDLVLAGFDFLADGGSFTLTSGVLDRDPVAQGINAATANAALTGFVKGAALEMPRQQRINVVSPGLLDVSEDRYGAFFPGHERVASDKVGRAYTKAVEGLMNGQTIIVD